MVNFVDLTVFLAIGILLPAAMMGAGALLRPQRPGKVKLEPYECGEIPVGDARIRYHIRYYIFALVFVVFDVETVFLYPWAVIWKSLGLFSFVEMMIFLGILVIGLIYAWKKRVLEWI